MDLALHVVDAVWVWNEIDNMAIQWKLARRGPTSCSGTFQQNRDEIVHSPQAMDRPGQSDTPV